VFFYLCAMGGVYFFLFVAFDVKPETRNQKPLSET